MKILGPKCAYVLALKSCAVSCVSRQFAIVAYRRLMCWPLVISAVLLIGCGKQWDCQQHVNSKSAEYINTLSRGSSLIKAILEHSQSDGLYPAKDHPIYAMATDQNIRPTIGEERWVIFVSADRRELCISVSCGPSIVLKMYNCGNGWRVDS
jgi:hypothetical protein